LTSNVLFSTFKKSAEVPDNYCTVQPATNSDLQHLNAVHQDGIWLRHAMNQLRKLLPWLSGDENDTASTHIAAHSSLQ